MKSNPIRQLEYRLEQGKGSFPNFVAILKSAAQTSINFLEGVILIGHSPHIAPESYCHSLYPPLSETTLSSIINKHGSISKTLVSLLRMMNGATLFWGGIEIWGIRQGQNNFCLPAYDIFDPSFSSRHGFLAIASNNCGDIIYLNLLSSTVLVEPIDKGLPTITFDSLDDWIVYEKGISDEVFSD